MTPAQKRVPFSTLRIGDRFQFSCAGAPRRFPESLASSPEDSTVWVKVSQDSYERTDHVVLRELPEVESLVWPVPHEWERELPADPRERAGALCDRAQVAYRARRLLEAGRIASELQSLADRNRDGFRGDYLHRAHTICGLIALEMGDAEEARERLLLSGRVPATATLSSFGPSMALARALVDRGERDVVLEYLALCRSVWTHGRELLDGWVNQLRASETPDFRPNAGY